MKLPTWEAYKLFTLASSAVLLGASLGLATSCADSLDLSPIDYYGAGSFWQNEEQAIGNLTAQMSQFRGQVFNWVILYGEIRGGAYTRASSGSDGSSLYYQYLRDQNFDWWDEATQVATTQNYNLGYKFGNEKIRSYISADYYTEDGAIKGFDYDRITLRSNTDYVVNNRLTLKAGLALSYKETFDQQHSLSYASYTPWDTPYNSKGELKTGREGMPSKEDAATADPRDYWYSDGGYNYLKYSI